MILFFKKWHKFVQYPIVVSSKAKSSSLPERRKVSFVAVLKYPMLVPCNFWEKRHFSIVSLLKSAPPWLWCHPSELRLILRLSGVILFKFIGSAAHFVPPEIRKWTSQIWRSPFFRWNDGYMYRFLTNKIEHMTLEHSVDPRELKASFKQYRAFLENLANSFWVLLCAYFLDK